MFQFIAVARKRPHDGRSDECKGLHVTTKKNSWKRTKAVILKKESKREQDDGASVKLEVETKEDEEGKAVIALLLVRF